MKHIEIQQRTYYIIRNKSGVPQKNPLGIVNFDKETGWAFKQGEGARAITHGEMADIAQYLEILNFDKSIHERKESND